MPPRRTVFQQSGPDHAPAILARARLRIRADSPGEAVPLIDGLRARIEPDVRVEMCGGTDVRELNRAEARAALEKSERSREYVRVWITSPISSRFARVMACCPSGSGRDPFKKRSCRCTERIPDEALPRWNGPWPWKPGFHGTDVRAIGRHGTVAGTCARGQGAVAKIAERMSLPPSADISRPPSPRPPETKTERSQCGTRPTQSAPTASATGRCQP